MTNEGGRWGIWGGEQAGKGYRRHAPRLFAVVWRLCGGQQARAEDALQEAFLQAWKALPAFRMDSSIATWLHRLAVNAALMELRARSNQAHDSLDDADLDLPEMHVHDRSAGIERGPCLARHLLGSDRNVVLRRVGEHAGQRAGEDGLVAGWGHASSSSSMIRSPAATVWS